MSTAGLSRRARRFVVAGIVFLVAWGVATLFDAGRGVGVVLGLYGFVLHTVFGKAYSLVPSYFDRELAFPRAPSVQLPLSTTGTAALAAGGLGGVPAWVPAAGAVLWGVGVVVFVGSVLWTVRDNLSGAQTGTGESNARRRPVDRGANALVPVALAYLLGGAYATAAVEVAALPPVVDGYAPRVSHLLAAGAATVMLFAVGFRLLPRFMVAHPPRVLVWVVLPAGALGPALIAAGLTGGGLLLAGAILEALAVGGFAAVVATLFYRSDRRRVGFWGVLAGAAAGVTGVTLGVAFALRGPDAALVVAHYRLNLLGFLGTTIVGVAYQFYPPNVGRFPGANDRTALASVVLLALGLVVEVAGRVLESTAATTGGETLALLGSLVYGGLVLGVFRDRYGD